MYVFEDGKTLKYTENSKGWTVEINETIRESAGSNISAVLPSQYKNQLDIFIEQNNKWKNHRKTEEVKSGDLCRLFDSNVYKLRKTIYNEDFNINILSMEIQNEPSGKLELTEEECENLGLTYEPGLFSIAGWTKLKLFDPIIERFDPDNLETYEASCIKTYSNTIRYMIISLSGFTRTDDPGVIKTPKGLFIDLELFLISLEISYNKDLPSFSGTPGRKKGENIRWFIIHGTFPGSEKIEQDEVCDIDGKIYLVLDLTRDNKGLKPQVLSNTKPSELFSVSWDISFSNLVNETTRVEQDNMGVLFNDNIFIERFNIYWREINKNYKYIPLVKQKYT